MQEIERSQRIKSTNKKDHSVDNILVGKLKQSEEVKLKPIGFVASKNKDFSIKKIYPVSTFYFQELQLLIICLIDKEIKVYNLD